MANEIILFHYYYSPYARRVVWYLNLRGIPYTQCLQPSILPRPDTASIGTVYRRIPILSIGRDIYNDTRLIIFKLEQLYPASSTYPAISTPDQKGYERIFERWTVDSGVFVRASQLLPTNLTKDPAFQKDRKEMSGRSWDEATVEKMRPEALVEMRAEFAMLEDTWLADGREWLLKTERPSLADIEAIWPLIWLNGLPGALPPNLISRKQFPKVFAWIERFQQATSAAAKKAGKAKTVKGPEALSILEGTEYAEKEGDVDVDDPLRLKKGDLVEVYPIDSGFNHKDSGSLVVLNGTEIVIEGKTKNGKEVRVHAPRHGFRVRKARNPKL